jgi:CHAT domain-containing protein/tetratricopeptide (TPR) repeat protein
MGALRSLVLTVGPLFASAAAGAQYASGGVALRATEKERATSLVRQAEALARGRPADRRSAIGLLEQAIRIYRDRAPIDEGLALFEQARLFESLNQADSALFRYRRLEQIAIAAGEANLAMGAQLGTASARGRMGHTDSAVAALERARLSARSYGDRQNETAIVGQIAYVLKKAMRYDEALARYRIALLLSRENGLRQVEGVILNNIGTAFLGRGDPDSALAYYRRSLPVRLEVGDRLGEGASLHGIGVSWSRLGRNDSALVYFERALPIRRETQDREGEGATLTAFGFILAEQRKMYDSAIVMYEAALQANRDEAFDGGIIVTLQALSVLHHRRGRFEIAHAYADSVERVSTRFGRKPNSDDSQIRVGEGTQAIYAIWAQTWFGMAQRTGGDAERYAALAVAERGRNRSLLDLMRPSGDSSRSAAPATTLESLSAEGRALAQRALGAADRILEYHFVSDSLLIWVIGPQSITLIAQPVEVEKADSSLKFVRLIEAIQRHVDPRQASRGRNALLALERSNATRDPATRDRGLGKPSSDTGALRDPLRALARWLLPDTVLRLLPSRGEILVAPQGSLALVPFAALPAWDTVALGTRLAIRYSPSLRLIADSAAGESSTGRRSLAGSIIVANPRMPTRDPASKKEIVLPPLGGALAEGRWVASRVGTTLLSDSAATETRIRASISSAPLVHLATHGLAYSSESDVRHSWVALAESATDDGFLTVAELLDDPKLSLSAELVVLSACQTGLGQTTYGEGVVGLQRALLAKGARSTLVSLWSVSDEATSLLMRRFYDHWLGEGSTRSKAEALRLAQEDVRRTKGFEHPRYWAAFQLVGVR